MVPRTLFMFAHRLRSLGVFCVAWRAGGVFERPADATRSAVVGGRAVRHCDVNPTSAEGWAAAPADPA